MQQFESGIGPEYSSSDLEEGQEIFDQTRAFKGTHPEVGLGFGHDLEIQ
jgi:hypothetical protein